MPWIRSSLLFGLALSVLGVLNATDLAAQTNFMIGGGVSSPNGDMGDLLDSGYHGQAALELSIPVFPIALRGTGTVARFNAAGTGGGTMNQVSGELSGVLKLGALGIGPYFLGGWGKYRQDYSSEFGIAEAETSAGIHAGFGVRVGLLGIGGFAEVRIVNVNAAGGDLRYIPITVGFTF